MGRVYKEILKAHGEDGYDSIEIDELIKTLEYLKNDGFTEVSITMSAEWNGEYTSLESELNAEKYATKDEIISISSI